MKLSLLTPQNVSTLSNREIVSIHYRVHQLYSLSKKRGSGKNILTFLKNTHHILSKEMEKRKISHTSLIEQYLKYKGPSCEYTK